MNGTAQAESPRASLVWRKSHACNECKRRKVRCSGGTQCANCTRDRKECKRLYEAEQLVASMQRAWAVHLPDVKIEDAIQQLESGNENVPHLETPAALADPPETPQMPFSLRPVADEHPTDASPAEFSNAEDYEFDESQDFDNSTDGMGSLILEPGKVGYTGPQSGVAALKFLQTLHLYIPADCARPFPLDEPDTRSTSEASSADIARYITDYFTIYHTAYPVLHEGTFRARVSGALAKPRDGSWPLLYNMVVAIGAFVGGTDGLDADVPFYKKARESLTMDILEKGSLSYVQGLVLMANYLQKRNKPNSGFVLIGIGFSMALAIGLHREFGLPSSSPFTMELRRRAWWTLFIFVSGAQLTLGRPPVSLVGVNVRPPSNLDDHDLAVDMEQLPEPRDGPTMTSCLIHQVRLAKIANMVQVELLTHQIPSSDKATTLDRSIAKWRKDLPSYFDEQVTLEPWFEIPKCILIWRSFHLRIILNRPILFKTITAKENLDTTIGPISACLTAAEECVASICGHLEGGIKHPRGLAWYATYWLITGSFVQATCCMYDPAHALAPAWKLQLKRAVDCLSNLGATHGMALRARDILKKLLDQSELLPFFGTPGTSVPAPNGLQGVSLNPWDPIAHGQSSHNAAVQDQTDTIFFGEGGMPFPWYAQGSSDAELLDATGGIMLQGSSDARGPYYECGSWMPA
ncbi:fungal-specific transcription factor domain-containing protein [Thelonectria olida]|uniref:Fungal-specific transcription factor domain-containing protein n=1 Tax=Thelonectria olida TaxID=1576542 RepID=A0A9P8VSN7_9HYPO|nr:fungal-specific transcription factor domain-containing protein [Thelonectria olida]